MKRKRRADISINNQVVKFYYVLFNLAKKYYKISPYLSNLYIRLLFEFRKKYKISIPLEIKRFICRKCKNILIPGINLKVRLNSKDKSVMYICLNCGFTRRYKYYINKVKGEK